MSNISSTAFVDRAWIISLLAFGGSGLMTGHVWLALLLSSAAMIALSLPPLCPQVRRWRLTWGLICFVIALCAGKVAEAAPLWPASGQSCAGWSKTAGEPGRHQAATDWVEGFISSYDVSAAASWGKDKSGTDLLRMVVQTCKTKQNATVTAAAATMMSQLIKAAQQTGNDGPADIEVPKPGYAAGIGDLGCDKLKTADDNHLLPWLAGYLAAFANETGSQPAQRDDAPMQLRKNLSGACTGHPTSRIADAVSTLSAKMLTQ